ncbi:hypothetical protein Q3G72_019346 [Acer saccharum]|nr:hypothetical protein Q3G72_019346 [Acer saccharum]
MGACWVKSEKRSSDDHIDQQQQLLPQKAQTSSPLKFGPIVEKPSSPITNYHHPSQHVVNPNHDHDSLDRASSLAATSSYYHPQHALSLADQHKPRRYVIGPYCPNSINVEIYHIHNYGESR